MNQSTNKIPRVVIIGGGISGLAAARYIHRVAQERKISLELILLESSYRLGGAIESGRKEKFLLEFGPDSMAAGNRRGVDFAKESGLESDLIGTNPGFRTSFVAFHKSMHAFSEDVCLLAPKSLRPFLFSGLFSIKGKLRMLFDLFTPAKKRASLAPGLVLDESLGGFLSRRLGAECVGRLVQPMTAALYGADPEELSLEATFPEFPKMEQKHSSLIRGFMNRGAGTDPGAGLFVSFKGGLETLVERASEKIPEDVVRFGVEVKSVRKSESGKRRYKVCGEHFEIETDAVCLALPAHTAAEILRPLHQDLAVRLSNISYASGLVANLVYDRRDVPRDLNGSSFVVPSSEKRAITQCTFAHLRFPQHVAGDKAVLRVFMGGKHMKKMVNLSEREIMGMIRRDLKDILNINASPQDVHIRRYPQAFPIYRVGHLDLVRAIEAMSKQVPGVVLAGNGYRGAGIPECIQSGEAAGEAVFSYL